MRGGSGDCTRIIAAAMGGLAWMRTGTWTYIWLMMFQFEGRVLDVRGKPVVTALSGVETIIDGIDVDLSKTLQKDSLEQPFRGGRDAAIVRFLR